VHVECKNKSDTTHNGQLERTISESFIKYLSHIPGKREMKELQKTAVLDTANTLRNVLI